MKKMAKTLLYLFLSTVLIVAAVYSDINSFSAGSMLGSLFAGIVIPYLLQSIVDLTDNTNWKSTQRKLKRAGILQKDSTVRISFAYLFRIKVDGKYFLVQNSRTHKYQPVGGAYKFEKTEADYFCKNIPVENDDRIPVDKITEYDYRLLVKNKDLRKFVRRFNRTIHRENVSNLSREFIEEVFNTGILDKKAFGTLSYEYCGRHMTEVAYSSVFCCYELLLADVVEVKLSEEQVQLFRELMKTTSESYHFADAAEIKTLGVKYGTNDITDKIANHTPKILSENTERLVMRNMYPDRIIIDL